MSTPEKKKSKEKIKDLPGTETPLASAGQGGPLETVTHDDAPGVNQEMEIAKCEKEVDRLYRAYTSHLDLGLKAVAFFYAILGGILSIYFSGSGRISRDVVIVLLGLPIVMSIILGGIFLYGARLWKREVTEIREMADKLGITIWLKVELLGYALIIFGLLFYVVGGFLTWLIIRLLMNINSLT